MTPTQQVQLEIQQQLISEPRVLGPYSALIRCTGFYVPKNRCLATSLVATAVCLLLLVGFIARFVFAVLGEYTPLSLRWADANIMMGVAFYAVVSGVCLGLWTRSGFIDSFQRELVRLKTLRVNPNEKIDVYNRMYLAGAFCSILMIATYVLSTFKGILYPLAELKEFETFTIVYRVSFDTLFGLGPIIFVWMGVVSFAATFYYSLCMTRVEREFNYFNEELRKASKAKQLALADIFDVYGRRHFELMQLLETVNSHLGKFAAIAVVGPILALPNTTFMMMTFMKEGSIVTIVATLLWLHVCLGMMMVLLGQPGKIQEEVHSTKCILMNDEILPIVADSRIQHSYRMFLDRCENRSTISIMRAFPIDRHLAHRVLVLVPNFGTLMSIIYKLINN